MKKRILAMLLLVAMIVTALPLMVLPTLAAEEEEKVYTEADYNKLFVTNGMVAGADFYTTNRYWGGTEKTATTAADAKKILDTYIYPGSTTFNNPVLNAGTFSIKDGYVDLGHLKGEWQFYNIEKLMGYGTNGSAVELVRAAKRSAYLPVINSLRISTDAAGNVTAINNSSHTMYSGAAAITASNKLGTAFAYKDYSGVVHTYTANMQRNAITAPNCELAVSQFAAANPGKITQYYTSATASSPANYYSGSDAYAYTKDADGKVTVDLGQPVYTLEEHGSNVNATAVKGTAVSSVRLISTREYPSSPVIPDYIKDAEGNVTENTAGTAYWIAYDRYVNGAFSVYQDGTMLYDNDAAPFVNNGFYWGTDSFIVLWGSDAAQIDNSGKFYAARYYNRELTDAEIAQNHMADILKWFKIDLTVLETVTEADYAKLAPAFAAFTFESDPAAVEAALVAEVTKVVTEKYAGTVASPYATLAVQYQLDLSPLLASPKGMLSNTYKFLNGGYNAASDVKAGYAAAIAADYAAMWESVSMGLTDYDELYAAQDAALISLDFFKTNEIWGEEVELPTPPAEQTAYEYDGKVYDFTKEENRLVQYDRRWAVVRSDKVFVYRTKTGGWNTGNANYPATNLVVDNFSANMPRQTFTYEEAQAVVEAVKTYWKSFTYSIVEIPLWSIWSTRTSDGKAFFYTTAGTWSNSNSKDAKVYMTKAEAEAALASTAATGYSSYTVKLRPIASAAYYQCIQDYCLAMANLMYSANINETRTIGFTQNITTIGEAEFHTQDGASHVYTHVRFENGALVLDPHHSGPYFSVTNVPSTGTVFLDVVMSGGTKEAVSSTGTKVMVIRNQNVMISINSGVTSLVSFGGQTLNATVEGVNTPFHLTVNSVADEAGKNATFDVALNGTELISDMNKAIGQSLLGHSQNSAAEIYTYRIYNRTLTAAEQAQNHFVDIAKYFKLNINGYDALDAEGKAAVWAAVAGINFNNTRYEAQDAVNSALNAAVDATYEALKAAYPAHADFIELAREYRIDVAAVLTSDEDMSAVYALTFDGLSCAEAQALVDDTYSDIINFYVHQRAGEDEWNAWLNALAAADTVDSIDNLLILPFAERIAILDEENNTDAAVIEAFIADALSKYTITSPEFDSYNALYVQDGLLFAADFFGSNKYWNIAYDMPVGPSDNTAYLYDADGDGTPETYDLTNAAARATKITAEEDENNGKTVFAVAKAEWQTAYKDYLNTNFLWTNGSMKFSVFTGSSETQERAPFTLTDGGYVQFHGNYASSGGLLFTGTPSNLTTSTAQFVFSLSKYDDNGESTAPFLFHNIRPIVTAKDGEVTFGGFTGASSMGGLYYSQLVVEGSTDKITYAEYDSKMMPSREKLTASAEEYAAKLTAEATDGATYTAVKINVVKYEIHKNGVKYATMTLENKPDPNYTLVPNADIKYAFDEPFTMSVAAELRDGDDYFILRTEDGVVGQIEAPYEVSGTKLDYSTHYIGWGVAHKHMRAYAFRQYDRVLTDAEVMQNHFADLAKYYRLDLSGYYMMDDEQKAATHVALNGFDLGTDAKDAIQAALNAETAKLYAGKVIIEGNEADNAKFLEIATIATLDLSAIMMLTPDARAEFAYGMLADFDPAYPTSGAVIAYHYAARTELFSALTFAGYQVRLDTGASLANYAGVRAVFDIDEAAIAAILAKNEGKSVILMIGATGLDFAGYTITYTMVEGKLVATGAEIYDRADGKSVNVMVTYKGDEITKENLALEYSFNYTIAISDAEATAFAVNSATFGDSVSAAELYGYFYNNGYMSDRVVAEMYALCAE